MNRVCYLPQPVDRKMAELCGWTKENKSQFSPYYFANLRGLYDTEHPNANLEVYDAQSALDTLIKYKDEIRKKRYEDIQWAQNNTSQAYERLKEAYSVKEEDARVDFLFVGLVNIIDNLAKNNASFTRKEIIQGVSRDGKYYGGQRFLFDALYDKLFKDYSFYTAIAKGDNTNAALYPGITAETAEYRAKVCEKIFQNWGLLTQRVRLKMKDMEGLKMMPKYDLSIPVNEGELSYTDMAELYDPESNTLEHWQEHTDEKASINDVDQDIKRLLHLIPVTYIDATTGEYKIQYDDMGSPQLMSFAEVYQKLKDMLGPVHNELDAIGTLSDHQEEAPWVKYLRDALNTNRALRSKFTVAFMLNRQEYTDVTISQDRHKRTSYRFRLLNHMRNPILRELLIRARKGINVSNRSIYRNKYTTDEKGNKVFRGTVINWENLFYIRKHILDALVPPIPAFRKLIEQGETDMNEFIYEDGTKLDVTDSNTPNTFYFKHTTKTQRMEFIKGVSNALGIDMTQDEAFAILRDRNLQRQYIKYIFDIVHYGLDTFLSDAHATKEQWQGKNLDKLQEFLYVSSEDEWNSVVRDTYDRTATGMRRYNEIINKMTLLLSRVRSEQQGERKIFRKNRTGKTVPLYNDIKPNYMGDVFEDISEYYIKNNNKEGLKGYLERNYLCSPLFAEKRDDGSYYIYNRWLRQLWEIANSNTSLNTVANMRLFQYNRFLGTEKEDFEQLSPRQNAIDMIVAYYAPYMQTKNDDTAWYPIFVLGDSNKSKYVRQKRYSFNEIIDGFYDIFIQERRRMATVKAMNKYLDEKGIQETGKPYKHIDNVDKNIDKYTMLTFLNDPKYHIDEDASEDRVKEVITDYLINACDSFKEYLQNLGVLDTINIADNNGVSHKEYRYLQDIINKSGKKRGAISNEETMTKVINDFYLNYKFAMLEQLNMMTIDNGFYKNTKDEQKRYKELHASGSKLNMTAKDEYKGRDPKTGKLVSLSTTKHQRVIYFDDITIDGEETQPEFMTVIEHLFGKDSEVYKKYKENTLTDGQAYRSLTSYRKICMMAGTLWSDEQEKAYQHIMNIRATYGKGEIPSEVLRALEKEAALFQPLKPYTYCHEHVVLNDKGDTMLIPVQHKYAEVPVIPELLPQDSKLRDMGYYMEENDIDMIMSTKCVKVGAFGSTKIDHLEQYDGELDLKGDDTDNTTRLNYALSLGYVHQLPLANYRIQSVPPNHIHQANKRGTQFTKLIMRGAVQRVYNPLTQHYEVQERYDKDGHNIYEKYVDYNKVLLNKADGPVAMNSSNIVALYNSLLMSNYITDMQTFLNTVNSNKKLSDLMTQITLSNSRYSLENLSSYALNENGELSLPLFDGTLEQDTSSMILSLYKKLVNQQVMNGGAAVQASAMGIKDYSEDGGLKYVCEGDNVIYAEIEMPFDFTYKDSKGRVIALQYDDFCNNDGTLMVDSDGVPLLDKAFPGIRDILAIRYPSEGFYSMINAKIVRFSRKMAGGTIKVPLQGTTIGGFDFDIDKLYFMRKEFVTDKRKTTVEDQELEDLELNTEGIQDEEVLKERQRLKIEAEKALLAKGIYLNQGKRYAQRAKTWVTYDYNKLPMENSKTARNNLYLQIAQHRLTDPTTIKDRLVPGGFPNASFAARCMRELMFTDPSQLKDRNGDITWDAVTKKAEDPDSDPEPNYDPSDPQTLLLYNAQNQIAITMIGIFANHETNNALTSLCETFMLNRPILIAGHTAEEGFGYDLLNSPKGRDINKMLEEFIDSSVDAVKDPVLNYLNLTTLTADIAALLARVGYNFNEIGVFLNQPLIKEATSYAADKGVILQTAITAIEAKYAKLAGMDVTKINPENCNMDVMAGAIVTTRTSDNWKQQKEFLRTQLGLLKTFENIGKPAEVVGDMCRRIKGITSTGIKTTIGGMYAIQSRMSNFISKLRGKNPAITIVTKDGKVNAPIDIHDGMSVSFDEAYMNRYQYDPMGYEQCVYDCNNNLLQDLSRFYPYEKNAYRASRARLTRMTKNKYLDETTIESIHRDLLVYLFSHQDESVFKGDNITEDAEGNKMTTYTYFTTKFADEVLGFLAEHPEYKEKYAILKALMPNRVYKEEMDNNTVYLSVNTSGLANTEVERLFERSWAEMLKDDNPQIRSIALKLFLYGFYTNGFDVDTQTIIQYAPLEIKKALNIPTAVNEDGSYVDFLRLVLNQNVQTVIDDADFTKQYIKNHSTNTKLVTTVYLQNRDLKANIDNQIKNNLNDSFTVDLTAKGAEEFVLRKSTGGVECLPAIFYDGCYYMAASESEQTWNTTDIQQITYVRYEPTYDSYANLTPKIYTETMQDNNEDIRSRATEVDLGPSLATTPQTTEEKQEMQIETDNPVTLDRSATIALLAEEMDKANRVYQIYKDSEDGSLFTKDDFVAFFSQQEDEVLNTLVNELKTACRKDGIVVFDANGQLMQSC